jgi:hypothetical protein
MVLTPSETPPLRLLQLEAYWRSLAAGSVPDRRLLEPGRIVSLLPYVLIAALESDPFRVRYRLTGTRVDEMTGLNITGRYLDEFAQGEYRDVVKGIQDAYVLAQQQGRPVMAPYYWPNQGGMMREVWMGIFPLLVDGAIRQCISIEDYGALGHQHEQPLEWSLALRE